MFHFANSALTEGNVVDNMLANPYVGFASKAAEVVHRNADGRPTVERPFWYDFRAGFLWAPQRDRIADEGWKAPWAANCACVWAGRGSNSRTTSM